MLVCVTALRVCVTERRPISGRFSTAPNSQTLWSGRQSWQSWHLSLSGWERMVCEWPGAGWDTLNHLHHVSVGLHAWVCTSGCLCYERDRLQMFRLCTALLCCAHSVRGECWCLCICQQMPKSIFNLQVYLYREFYAVILWTFIKMKMIDSAISYFNWDSLIKCFPLTFTENW